MDENVSALDKYSNFRNLYKFDELMARFDGCLLSACRHLCRFVGFPFGGLPTFHRYLLAGLTTHPLDVTVFCFLFFPF